MDNIQSDEELVEEMTPLARKLHLNPHVAVVILFTILIVVSLIISIGVWHFHRQYHRRQQEFGNQIVWPDNESQYGKPISSSIRLPLGRFATREQTQAKDVGLVQDGSFQYTSEEKSVDRQGSLPIMHLASTLPCKRDSCPSGEDISWLGSERMRCDDRRSESEDEPKYHGVQLVPDNDGKENGGHSYPESIINPYRFSRRKNYHQSSYGSHVSHLITPTVLQDSNIHPISTSSFGGLGMYSSDAKQMGMGSPVSPLTTKSSLVQQLVSSAEARHPSAVVALEFSHSSERDLSMGPRRPLRRSSLTLNLSSSILQSTSAQAEMNLVRTDVVIPSAPTQLLVANEKHSVRRRGRGLSLAGEIMRMKGRPPHPISGGPRF